MIECFFFFFQAEDGIRDIGVTGVQTCALPILTSVDRDDLADAGAGHYAATIRALRRAVPAASVEILTPDFLGCEEQALHTVLAERPDVFNHNMRRCGTSTGACAARKRRTRRRCGCS